MAADLPQRRAVVSYVHRGGRMTRGQQRAWDTSWSRYGRTVAELPPGPLDFDAWFGAAAPLAVEIGSGMGESTAAMAQGAPERHHVAVEVYQPGLAQLLLRIEQAGLTNLRLLRGDGIDVLRENVATASLAEVRIFFPDPWPKTRHHKRRLIQPSFVSLVASRLAPGGQLRLATDWESYAHQMLEVCEAEPMLRHAPHAAATGFIPRPADRPLTKFESRAQAEGRTVHDLLFARPD